VPPLPMPDIPEGKLRDLITELHNLHTLSGWPSLRDMAKGQSFSYATVHDLFTRPRTRAPQPKLVLAVVEHLATQVRKLDVERTLDRFDALWREAAVAPFSAEAPPAFRWLLQPDGTRRRVPIHDGHIAPPTEEERQAAATEMQKARQGHEQEL
jgi:hypothetical protein